VTVTVQQGLPAGVTVSANPGDSVCPGTVVVFTAIPDNGGASPFYQWFLNGAATGGNTQTLTLTPANGDVIFCRVTSNLPCATNNPASSTLHTVVYVNGQNAAITISADHSFVCPGTTVTCTAAPVNPGATPVYDWMVNGVSVQQGSSPVYITNSLTGGESIVCKMTSSLTCLNVNPVQSSALSLTGAQAPVVKLSDKAFLCSGDSVRLDAGAGFSSYLWQDSSTSRYFTAINQGVYRVTVLDSLGCTAGDSIALKVCSASVFVPDAFSPNDDGLNDEFRPITTQEGITSFSLRIFNRWGEMVFESNDLQHGWNGKVNGTVAPPGTYVWKIDFQVSTLTTGGNSSTSLHGNVILVR
jgi:gliding motility-associated-like protein